MVLLKTGRERARNQEKQDEYVNHFSVYDGRPYSEKKCMKCNRDMERFAKAHNVGWFTPSGWLEFVELCIDDDGEDADPRWKMMKIRANTRRRDARRVLKQEAEDPNRWPPALP